MNKLTSITIGIAGLSLIVLFQNCTNTNIGFNTADPRLVSNGALISTTTDPDATTGERDSSNQGSTRTDVATGDDSVPQGGSTSSGDGTDWTPPATTEDPPVVEDPADPGSGGQTQNPADPEDPDQDSDLNDSKFICILGGPGKSVRLGYTNQRLAEIGETPQVVCMTENACVNIVAQSGKFEVKGPEPRGFCPNKNPYVIPLTDNQVQAKINEL